MKDSIGNATLQHGDRYANICTHILYSLNSAFYYLQHAYLVTYVEYSLMHTMSTLDNYTRCKIITFFDHVISTFVIYRAYVGVCCLFLLQKLLQLR